MSAQPVELDQAPARTFGHADLAILEFERLTWGRPGAKDAQILDRFGLTPTRYYARLRWILDQPEAVAYDAATVGRLRRLNERRAAVRTRGTTAAGVATFSDGGGTRPAMHLAGGGLR